jgi:hypothetical protein
VRRWVRVAAAAGFAVANILEPLAGALVGATMIVTFMHPGWVAAFGQFWAGDALAHPTQAHPTQAHPTQAQPTQAQPTHRPCGPSGPESASVLPFQA